VVEAVAEDLEVKRRLFSRIEPQVSAEAILASNTSSFPISDLAADLSRPRQALITHWFNPPHIVPLVEVVPGEKTGTEAVEATLALLRQVGKSPVQLKKEVPGFLVNRIQIAMLREILDLLDRGVADPEEIDRAVKSTIGFRLAAIGPLEVIDFAGLDVTASVFENLVVAEALKYRFNRGRRSNLSFFRDSRGLECDLFYETGHGIGALEIKSGATIASDYFTSLHRVAALIPRITAKAVIYGGDPRQARSDAEAVPLADLCDALDRFESTSTPPALQD